MTEIKSRGFKIIKLVIERFKGIKTFFCDAGGKHILIQGPNGSGKTSAADALLTALQGWKRGAPNPVRIGESQASVVVTLGNGEDKLVVSRHIDAESGNTNLYVTKNGAEVKSPQSVINTLLTKYMLDPMAFLQLRKADQMDIAISLSTEKPPVAEVLKITNVMHQAEDGETAYKYLSRLSADKTGLYYMQRAELAKERDQKVQALAEAKERLLATPEVPQPASIEDLRKKMAEICELITKHDAEQRAYDARETLRRNVFELATAADDARLEVDWVEVVLTMIRQLRQKVAAGVDLGVSGLEINEEQGLCFGNVPLASASQSQQLKVAMAVAIKQNKGLSVVRLDEGERLDHRTMMEFYNLCDENDCQAVITRVENCNELSVTISDV